MYSKKLLVPVFAVIVGAVALLGVSTAVHAQGGTNPFSGLAQALAAKFNLNQSDVQNTISTYMQQTMQEKQKSRLDQLVSQGKITSGQETAILSELATLQSQYGASSLLGMTPAQRQQVMLDRRNAITAWANGQGINPMYVMSFGMGRSGGWHRPVQTPTPTL